FFFQAEDGIRDFHVTGVQTCALPISSAPVARNGRRQRCSSRSAGSCRSSSYGRFRSAPVYPSRGCLPCLPDTPAPGCGSVADSRSEERRVGKEGRSWGEQQAEEKTRE